MWFAIIGSLLAVFALGILYLSFRFAHFRFIRTLTGSRRWLSRLLSFFALAALTALLSCIWNMMNAVVVLIHLVAFFLICDFVSFIVSKTRKQKPEHYYSGAIAVALCVLYLGWGWYNAHHVSRTDYTFASAEITDEVRIVQITDSHIGATFHADGFLEYIEEINTLSPDAVVFTGDFVDDGTSRDDLLKSCEALGKLKAKYGVFFVFGNHDRGYFNAASRGWAGSDLRRALEENGVTVLEDTSFEIGGKEIVDAMRQQHAVGEGITCG